MGVISGIPTDMTEDEVMTYVEVPKGCGKILKVRRINRKVITEGTVEWKPTGTCVVTFDGQTLPNRVFCGYTSLAVSQYIYPTIQCRKCCRFGHVEAICRSKSRCFKCSQEHQYNECDVSPSEAFCVLCSGSHFANSRSCPEYTRQKAIKTMMAEKAVSYLEASKAVPSTSRSYASATKAQLPSNPVHQAHRKTVFLPPKSHVPLPPSYDKYAHQNIFRPPKSSQSNLCALNYNSSQSHSIDSSSIIQLLIKLLSSLLSKNNSQLDSPTAIIPDLPSNDAENLITFLLTYTNGSQPSISSVEC